MSFRIPVGYTPLGPTLSTARSAGLQRNVGLPQSASDSVRQATFGSSIGPQRERFRSNGVKDVYTTFSLLVGIGRGFCARHPFAFHSRCISFVTSRTSLSAERLPTAAPVVRCLRERQRPGSRDPTAGHPTIFFAWWNISRLRLSFPTLFTL
jgi:hypothetical protein